MIRKILVLLLLPMIILAQTGKNGQGTKVAVVSQSTGSTTTTNVAEGTNLYFTIPRVLAAPLTGFVATSGAITATDNVLQGIQKLHGNKVFSKTQAATANYTLTNEDEFMGVLTSGITITLPDPSTNEGRKVSVVMMVEGSVNFNYPINRTRSGFGVISTTVISTDASAGAGWSWNSIDLIVMGGQYWLY